MSYVSLKEGEEEKEGFDKLCNDLAPLETVQFFITAVNQSDYDPDFLTLLERVFLVNMHEADGPTLVSIISAHSDWA